MSARANVLDWLLEKKDPGVRYFFDYPMGSVTDALRNADVLAALGRDNDRSLKPLVELILSKRHAGERWLLEYRSNRKTRFTLEGRGQPSMWVTLSALRAVCGMGVETC